MHITCSIVRTVFRVLSSGERNSSGLRLLSLSSSNVYKRFGICMATYGSIAHSKLSSNAGSAYTGQLQETCLGGVAVHI